MTISGRRIGKLTWRHLPPLSKLHPLQSPKEKDFGFLSLNRAISLDSVDLDLSRELSKPSKATLDRQVAIARQMAAGAATAKVLLLMVRGMFGSATTSHIYT
jgi:hypothetical protein